LPVTLVLDPSALLNLVNTATVSGAEAVTSTLDPWECFLDLSDPDRELTPTSALLELVVGNTTFLVPSVLLGLALTALVLVLGNNVFTGNGRRTETEA